MSNTLKNESQSDDYYLEKISEYAMKETGVQLGPKQKNMVEARLKKRMMDLSIETLAEYYNYFEANRTEEGKNLISLLTTHHTYFFREFQHFEYLANTALPQIIPEVKKRADRTIRVWSAACSRGHEVYSLSMFLWKYIQQNAPDLKFQILGSDVDAESVQIANNGVYRFSEISGAPMVYIDKHWAHGTKEISDFVKAKKSIKDPCSFKPVNLFQIQKDMQGTAPFDIIFCRNVFIYFNGEQIQKITKDLLSFLLPHGFLVLGLSESLNGLGVEAESYGFSIYGHKKAPQPKPAVSFSTPAPKIIPASTPSAAQPIRVFCVDDSPTIHTMLNQILKPENGFKIVGKAMNGVEAAKNAKWADFDVMTLDIHMPELDGIGYLEKHFRAGHPPVVMLSSVDRENSTLAMRALELGATDYVEKPALANLRERADEIYIKLKSAKAEPPASKRALALERSFSHNFMPKNPEKYMRILIGGLKNKKDLIESLSQAKLDKIPSIVLMEGATGALHAFSEIISKKINVPVACNEFSNFKSGSVTLADANKLGELKNKIADKNICFLIYGNITQKLTQDIASWGGAGIYIEEGSAAEKNKSLRDLTQDIFPITSFIQISLEYFTKFEKK